jgi:hypothetical protein
MAHASAVLIFGHENLDRAQLRALVAFPYDANLYSVDA